MSQQDFDFLKEFLEARDVSHRAAAPLKDGTVIGMVIVGDPEPSYVLRESKRTVLKRGTPPKDPDLRFTISPAAIKRLHDFPSEDIGEFGVEFFRIMVSKEPDMELGVKLNVGVFGLTRLGFFGILALGGPAVMGFLARQGLRSLKDIRNAIAKVKSD